MGRSLSQHRHSPCTALVQSTLHTTTQNREPHATYHSTTYPTSQPAFLWLVFTYKHVSTHYTTLHRDRYIIHLVWYLLQPSSITTCPLCIINTDIIFMQITVSKVCKNIWISVPPSSPLSSSSSVHTEYYRWAFTVVLGVRPAPSTTTGLADWILSQFNNQPNSF